MTGKRTHIGLSLSILAAVGVIATAANNPNWVAASLGMMCVVGFLVGFNMRGGE